MRPPARNKKIPRSGRGIALHKEKLANVTRNVFATQNPDPPYFPVSSLISFLACSISLTCSASKRSSMVWNSPTWVFSSRAISSRTFLMSLSVGERRHLLVEVDGVQLGDDGRPENFLVEVRFGDFGKIRRQL